MKIYHSKLGIFLAIGLGLTIEQPETALAGLNDTGVLAFVQPEQSTTDAFAFEVIST